MLFLRSFLMLTFVRSDETLEFVRGPSAPLVAPLGGSVVLPCYVETPFVKKFETVKVVWRRTDSETQVQLYQDGESRPEAQQEDYRDRAHFFTDQIQHGNFSIRLDNLTAEDNGEYMCKVYTQVAADKTLVEIKVVEHLLSSSDELVLAHDGEDVTLNCSVDSHITPEHIEEVSWRKTDEDILVLLYQNNETLPGSSDEQYRGRVEFFTDEIPKGNFSLRLKRVRTEDKGVYMCLVFAGGLSANATVVLERLGFSVSDTLVLIFCVFASASGSAQLIYCLVNSRSEDRGTRQCRLLCLLPNITMLSASVTWFIIDGSLYETVCCCLFYILQPLRLIWVSPYAADLTEKMKKYITIPHADHPAFLVVMYSVLLAEHFDNINPVIKTATFGLLILMCLVFITQLVEKKLQSCCGRIYSKIQQLITSCSFSLLPSLQLSLLLYTLCDSQYIFAVLLVLPFLHLVFFFCCDETCCVNKNYLNYLTKFIRITVIGMNAGMAYSYVMLLRNEKGSAGPVCVAGLVQALWVLEFSEVPACYPNFPKRKLLFLFESVGLVVVNSAALMTKVIMKAVTGARLLGDLRITLLLSEGLFTTVLMLLSIVVTRKPVSADSQEDYQMSESKGTPATKCTDLNQSMDLNQKTPDSHELESLREAAGNSEEQEEETC